MKIGGPSVTMAEADVPMQDDVWFPLPLVFLAGPIKITYGDEQCAATRPTVSSAS